MSYRDYEVLAERMDDGAVRLCQGSETGEDDVIVLTPEQLIRIGEWANSFVKLEPTDGG